VKIGDLWKIIFVTYICLLLIFVVVKFNGSIDKKCRKLVKTISICFISIIGIESFQFITMLGYFDIDDILLNILGCLIGYCVYCGLRILLSKQSDLFQNT
jgi:glycopeptide antibiotics resistance protein